MPDSPSDVAHRPEGLTDALDDQRLARSTRPPDRPNPRPADRYDVVVLGAGAGGLVAAGILGQVRGRVAVVEGSFLGGDCTVTGCVPSKALLDLAGRAASARHAIDAGWLHGEVSVDGAAILAEVRRRRALIGDRETPERFEDLGMDVFLGYGTFTGPHRLDVAGHDGTPSTLVFDHAILANGSTPLLPPIDGLEEVEPLTNDTVWNLSEPPGSMIVIGGGPIGCELGQAFARLGTAVTIVESDRRVLPRDDPDAAAIVEAALRADGVVVHTSSRAQCAERTDTGIRVEVDGPDGSVTLEADDILVATGRQAPPDPGYAALGVTVDDDGFPTVDARMRTSAAHVHAIGDVALRTKFTHMASASAQTAAIDLLSPVGGPGLDQDQAPWVTFTSPSVGHLGLTPTIEGAGDLDVHEVGLDAVDRAVVTGDDAGFVRLYTRPGKATIVGASVVSEEAGEIVAQLAIAVDQAMSVTSLASVLYPYPTMGSAYQEIGQEMASDMLAQARPLLDAYWRVRRWWIARR